MAREVFYEKPGKFADGGLPLYFPFWDIFMSMR